LTGFNIERVSGNTTSRKHGEDWTVPVVLIPALVQGTKVELMLARRLLYREWTPMEAENKAAAGPKATRGEGNGLPPDEMEV
jgi:hypothetical protein